MIYLANKKVWEIVIDQADNKKGSFIGKASETNQKIDLASQGSKEQTTA